MKCWEDAARLPRLQLSRRKRKCLSIPTQSFFHPSPLFLLCLPYNQTLNSTQTVSLWRLSFHFTCCDIFVGFGRFLIAVVSSAGGA